MKKLKKSLIIVATLSCMLLALALSAMAANLDTTEGNGPDSSTANENSFLFTPIEKDDVVVHIGGNGNSARLSVVIPDVGTFTTNDRPVNNAVNTIKAAGFEIDVFVRGNKIDGVLGVWDLNCYNTCPTVGKDGEGCTPTRENSCKCACICVWECNHICTPVDCNIEGNGICGAPIPCDNSICENKPRDGIDCKKDNVWVCPWECECKCECEDLGTGLGCDHEKCVDCTGCIITDCDHEASQNCCFPCICSTTTECVHAHWVCDSCNGHKDNHGQHKNNCIELDDNPNKTHNFFCADKDCGISHPDNGWNLNDKDRPECFEAAGCTTDDCPDDECSGEAPPDPPSGDTDEE